MAEIQLSAVSKRWGSFVGVDNFNLTIADQEFLVLLGPSGCGKSMLCHVLCVCMTAQHKDLEVVYVDTRNTFSVKTLTDVIMWMWNGIQGEKEDLHTFQKSVLSRVRHVAAYELSDTFASLRKIDRVYTTSRSKSLGFLTHSGSPASIGNLKLKYFIYTPSPF